MNYVKLDFLNGDTTFGEKYGCECFPLYLCLRVSKFKSHISLINANITFPLTGYSCLTVFLIFENFQGHRSKVKVKRSPGALNLKRLPRFNVLKRNKMKCMASK